MNRLFGFHSEFFLLLANSAPKFSPQQPPLFVAHITIALVGAVLEVILLRTFCRFCHDVKCKPVVVLQFFMLNAITWLFILVPLVYYTGSVLIAEAAVVVAEGGALYWLFSRLDPDFSLGRAFVYSSAVNLVSYLTGILLE